MALRDWFTKDLGWKFFSVILALVIWLTVNYKNQDETAGAPRRENTYGDLPVMAVKLPAGWRAQIAPAAVTVTVSGPSRVMASLQAKEILAFVDLSGVESGRELHRSVDVAVPAGVTFVSVDPAEVTVALTRPAEENKEKEP
jgi:YbbR domain-containing protein